jgi:hypothetical protein
MRATFITTALENGARLEDVQNQAHAFSPDFMVAVWIIAGCCLDEAVLFGGVTGGWCLRKRSRRR